MNRRNMLKIFIRVTAVTFPLLYIAHLLFQNFLKKKKKELEFVLGIDVLKINHCLSFGIEDVIDCPHKEVSCKNMKCNIGKLCYLLNFVKESKEYLDVCIYFLSAKIFGDIIVEAHKRGVQVRVIADTNQINHHRNSWINRFLENDIPVRQKVSDNLMHHKFMIVDRKIIINGSMNFTMNGAFANWENVIISSQPALVQQFINEFQSLWDTFDPHIGI